GSPTYALQIRGVGFHSRSSCMSRTCRIPVTHRDSWILNRSHRAPNAYITATVWAAQSEVRRVAQKSDQCAHSRRHSAVHLAATCFVAQDQSQPKRLRSDFTPLGYRTIMIRNSEMLCVRVILLQSQR